MSAEDFFMKGNSLINLKTYDEATMMYKKAIEINPQYSLAYNGLGNVLFNKRNTLKQ